MPVVSKNVPTGFDHFGLHEALLRGVQAAGFVTPRPIQEDTIPAGLQGRDVLGLAQTGTGKTAAFALPLLHRIVTRPGPGPRVLILAPTRELATQIAVEIRLLSRHTRVQTVTVFGGVSTLPQVKALREQPEIVVGCPGRLIDLMQQRALRLERIEALVIDEADHMFDLGFLRDVRRILKALPKVRQNLLFSATMPREIRGLADELLADPKVVELADSAPASTIEHALVPVVEKRKRALLEAVLAQDDYESAIVFMRTKRRAKQLADQLAKSGHRAVALQGNMSQGARDRAMSGFRARRFDILVATDIAARGIDVTGVSHVINFDVPNTPEAYTHRIGRTGRAEREGTACTFVTPDDRGWVIAVERMIGAPIERREVPGFDPREEPARPRRSGEVRGRPAPAPRRAAARAVVASAPAASPAPAPAEPSRRSRRNARKPSRYGRRAA
jgi:ATP-dependent RNA helicase RhlE